jgi:hypothetical protein
MACVFACWKGFMQARGGGMGQRHQSSYKFRHPGSQAQNLKQFRIPAKVQLHSHKLCFKQSD